MKRPKWKTTISNIALLAAFAGLTTWGMNLSVADVVQNAKDAVLPTKSGVLVEETAKLRSVDQAIAAPACKPASIEEARELMLGLFPDAAFFETDDISNNDISSCLRRVDMMTDWANPATRGTVYVLADGNHFLNGPLMNSDSVLVDKSAATMAQGSEVQPPTDDTTTTENLAFLAHALTLLEKYENMPGMDESVAQQKADLLGALSIMPNQTVYHDDNPHTVYVIYDTTCPRCHELFAMQDEIADQYAARLVWIPTYLNEESRNVAAGLLQAASAEPGRAHNLLATVMQGDTTGLPDSPTPESFAQLEASAGYLRDLGQEHGLSTPLIVFRHSTGSEIEVINGIPPISEFAPLAAGSQ